jgi:hypothetical protein
MVGARYVGRAGSGRRSAGADARIVQRKEGEKTELCLGAVAASHGQILHVLSAGGMRFNDVGGRTASDDASMPAACAPVSSVPQFCGLDALSRLASQSHASHLIRPSAALHYHSSLSRASRTGASARFPPADTTLLFPRPRLASPLLGNRNQSVHRRVVSATFHSDPRQTGYCVCV